MTKLELYYSTDAVLRALSTCLAAVRFPEELVGLVVKFAGHTDVFKFEANVAEDEFYDVTGKRGIALIISQTFYNDPTAPYSGNSARSMAVMHADQGDDVYIIENCASVLAFQCQFKDFSVNKVEPGVHHNAKIHMFCHGSSTGIYLKPGTKLTFTDFFRLVAEIEIPTSLSVDSCSMVHRESDADRNPSLQPVKNHLYCITSQPGQLSQTIEEYGEKSSFFVREYEKLYYSEKRDIDFHYFLTRLQRKCLWISGEVATGWDKILVSKLQPQSPSIKSNLCKSPLLKQASPVAVAQYNARKRVQKLASQMNARMTLGADYYVNLGSRAQVIIKPICEKMLEDLDVIRFNASADELNEKHDSLVYLWRSHGGMMEEITG